MKNRQKTEHGIALSALAFVMMLILKLTGYSVVATWSWWWITAPIWLPVGLVVTIAYIGFIALIVYNAFKDGR